MLTAAAAAVEVVVEIADVIFKQLLLVLLHPMHDVLTVKGDPHYRCFGISPVK